MVVRDRRPVDPYTDGFFSSLLEGAVSASPSNDPTIQNYNTETSTNTTSSGASWLTPTSQGEYVYTSLTNAVATPCDLQPTQFPQDASVTINVLKCQPQFLEHTNGNTIRVGALAPPAKISVYLPSAMSGADAALRAAIADWNSGLPAGVQFEVVTTACQSGPTCITIVSDPAQQSCGFANRQWDSTGVITGNMELRLRSDWTNYSATGLQRTFAHELGHFLGSDNINRPGAPTCGVSDAVMHDAFDYGNVVSVVSPTLNDTRPIVNSVYGGNTKATCGW
jgi:hypothetical protein